jgi:nucleoid-associated protein YgaU
MIAANPVQPPCWSQLNREKRRRERFKKTLIVAVAAGVLLLVGLLILGGKSEREAMATPTAPSGGVSTVPAVPETAYATTMEQKPAGSPQFIPATASQVTPPVARARIMVDTSHSTVLYVVKSGDTLTRIAKAHGTTVKAIEAANDLTGDRIFVGAKLKIPAA